MFNLSRLIPARKQKQPRIEAVMITMDRSPKGNHLADSIKGLAESGFFQHPSFNFTLIHSGQNRLNLDEALAVSDNFTLVETGRLLQFNEAVLNALKTALANKSDVVLFMEDDIRVSTSFPQYVLDTLESAGGAEPVLDFVTYYVEVTDSYFQGEQFIEMEAKSFYGSQCYAMNADYAASFAKFIEENNPQKTGFCDVWFHDWLVHEKLEPVVKCAVPSGAQHIGRNSNQGHDYIEAPCVKDEVEQTRPFRTSQYSQVETDDESLTIRNNETNKLLSLNSSAHLIYLFCDGEYSLKQIISEIHAEVGGSRHKLDAEIRRGLFELKSLGVVDYQT